MAQQQTHYFVGILLLSLSSLSIAGKPTRAQQQEAQAFAEESLGARSITCGTDTYIKAVLEGIMVPPGSNPGKKYLVQLKDAKISVSLDEIWQEADKLNGIEAAGRVHFQTRATRVFDGKQWGDYRDFKSFPVAFSIEIQKKNGKWLSQNENRMMTYILGDIESPGTCAAIPK